MKYLYILLTMLASLSTYNMSYTKFKAALILFVGITLIDFCIRFKTKNIKTLGAFFLKYSQYIWILVVVSLIIYVADTSTTSLIARGGTKIFYQILTILIAICAVYEFEDKTVLYTFYGFALFNALAMVLAVKDTGSISQVISDIIYFITSMGDARGYMRYLELSEATFTFGLFIIYFVVDGVKKNKWQLLVAIFFFFTGFKRIGCFGVVVAIAVYYLVRRLDKPKMALIIKTIMFGYIIVGFADVVLVRSGLFVQIMNDLNIDMMGRQNLYQFIENYYVINPLFLGHGFESIKIILASAGDLKVNETLISKIQALHNDYLAMYIQMGFFGFFAWAYYKFVDVTSYCLKYSKKSFLIMAMANIYMGMTYLTDNSAMYFLPTIVLWMLPLMFVDSDKNELMLRGNDSL